MNCQLSTDKNLNPDDFFQSLLTDDDRFSWIQENYQELLNSLKGISKEAGFEFVLYQEDGSNNVLAQILYIKPGSPADNAGLKRGDAITHVNGQQLNTTNYKTVLKGITIIHLVLAINHSWLMRKNLMSQKPFQYRL